MIIRRDVGHDGFIVGSWAVHVCQEININGAFYLSGLTWGWLNTKSGQRYPPESDFSTATERQKKQSMTTGILNSKEIKSEYTSKMLNFNFTQLLIQNMFRKFGKVNIPWIAPIVISYSITVPIIIVLL